jgi:hypothetical protein
MAKLIKDYLLIFYSNFNHHQKVCCQFYFRLHINEICKMSILLSKKLNVLKDFLVDEKT